jgi:hypothetical protein
VFFTVKTAPEIDLEVAGDPQLGEGGRYRFEVSAKVSGKPAPEVTFNRDDSMGEAGKNRAVILLDPGETFVVTAAAKNPLGKSEATLELKAAGETGGTDPDPPVKTTGTIEGHLVHPSSHVPLDLIIMAENIDSGQEYWSGGVIQDSKYASGFGFLVEVPPGNYHLYARDPDNSHKAYYDVYVQSNYAVNSSEKIVVSIAAGEHVSDAVIGNWWNAVPVNRGPSITAFTVPDPLFRGEKYSLKVQASDPDGDPLTYQWEITGTGFAKITSASNPMTLTTTEAMQNITIRVKVLDNRGGEAARSKDAFVHPVLTLTPVAAESGFIEEGTAVSSGVRSYVFAGDSAKNKICRGFISFNTDFGMGGAYTFHKAVLRLAKPQISGDPSIFHYKTAGLWVEMVNWGPRPLQLSDYSLNGTDLKNFTKYDITFTSVMGESSELMVKEIEERLLAGKERLQFRLRFPRENSNKNLRVDGVRYNLSDIVLKVYMTPK